MNYDRERNFAIAAVAEAAHLCRAVGASISPETLAKKDRSPVTVADFGAQALICRALAHAFPDDPIIAEEDSAELNDPANASILAEVVKQVRSALNDSSPQNDIDDSIVRQWIDRGHTTAYQHRFWTIDPIDGTKGFLRGEQYAVALALVVGGHVVVGALACPNLKMRSDDASASTGNHGTIFYADKGQGSFALPAVSVNALTATTPVRLEVSLTDNPAACRFCESVESGHSDHNDAAAIAAKLGITIEGIRLDSQAKYAVVARGDADAYLRLPTSGTYREKIWDHAAGALIVTEAGGTVTDIHGRSLEFHHGRELTENRGVIVSNRRLHPAILDAVQSVLTMNSE